MPGNLGSDARLGFGIAIGIFLFMLVLVAVQFALTRLRRSSS